MAKVNIKGRQVALYLEKPAGSGSFVRYLCADTVGLTVNTEEIEVTADCEDVEDENAVVFKDFEDGAIDWTGTVGGKLRRIDGDDAATNFTAAELMKLQLAGTKLKMRFSLGTAVGADRFEGTIFFTNNNLNADSNDATNSATFRGKGMLAAVTVPPAV